MENKRFHIASLDGIRALAVLLVFFGHAGFGDVIPSGFGVTVFFFLSGYLITTLLRIEFEKTANVHFKDFYLRRLYRIFPPFYVALVAALVLAYSSGDVIHFDLFSVSAQALYLTNYYQIICGYNVIPDTSLFWSLAVEEHYYLLFPLLLVFLLKRVSYSTSAFIFFIICVVVLFWRFYLVMYLGVPADHTNIATDTRIDSILYGCILGVWLNPVLDDVPSTSEKSKVFILCAALAVLLVTFLYRDAVFRETLRYSLQGLALLPLFYLAITCSHWRLFRVLNWRWVRKMGLISYAFYLFHMMVLHVSFNLTRSWGLENHWYGIISGLFVTLLIATAMYCLVEKRFMRMRKKLNHASNSSVR